jgi:hypothetical protein
MTGRAGHAASARSGRFVETLRATASPSWIADAAEGRCGTRVLAPIESSTIERQALHRRNLDFQTVYLEVLVGPSALHPCALDPRRLTQCTS